MASGEKVIIKSYDTLLRAMRPDWTNVMEFPPKTDIDAVDEIPRPVFSLITEATFVGETEPHCHNKAQLMYVISGVLTVQAAGGLATRYDRRADNYLAALKIVAARIWIASNL